jgi:hypothetical protein
VERQTEWMTTMLGRTTRRELHHAEVPGGVEFDGFFGEALAASVP